MMSVHEALNLPQQPPTVLSGSGAGPSSAHAATPSSAGTPTFGVSLPPRRQQRISGPGPSNGNGNGNGTAGTSKDDAIAIDDDDDDNTVALSTPAIPPTPAPLTHLPPSTYAAPPPPEHPTPVAHDGTCPMCRKVCGLDLRTCAERNGGRKGLKDRIRSLHANGNSGGDGITALYEVYQAVSLVLLFSVMSLTISGLGKKLRGRGSSESEHFNVRERICIALITKTPAKTLLFMIIIIRTTKM